jgi:hypothetical protein
VRGGQLAEVTGEPLLARVVDADTAEHQRLVLVQGRAQRCHRAGVQSSSSSSSGSKPVTSAPIRAVSLRKFSRVQLAVVLMVCPLLFAVFGRARPGRS